MGSQPNQNLEYIYASVQKKSAEQNKLSIDPYTDSYEMRHNMNIRDRASLSDNSGMRLSRVDLFGVVGSRQVLSACLELSALNESDPCVSR